VNSGRLKRFLRFSVEETLAGRAENLKEYTLALEVFDKSASHDPGADPIVRVEARRLRARLKEYYETDGLGDRIRIDIPKGAYVPSFQRVAPHARARRRVLLGVAAAILFAAVLAAWRHFRETPRELALTRLTSNAGLTTQPAISPDGKLLAYSSDRGGDGDLEIWVQPSSGGEPLRLTHIPADDHEPDFSTDSTRIVFRSERNGGGVFIVPAQGGEVRHLAEHGRNPRFSPDGNWVAYWVGSGGGDLLPPSAGKIFLVGLLGRSGHVACLQNARTLLVMLTAPPITEPSALSTLIVKSCRLLCPALLMVTTACPSVKPSGMTALIWYSPTKSDKVAAPWKSMGAPSGGRLCGSALPA
jgi:hypothetical protein